jgi:integrase
LLNAARVLGRLHDYFWEAFKDEVLSVVTQRKALETFYEARRFGYEPLGWLPIAVKTAQDELRIISEFSTFCANNFGHIELNPSEEILVSNLSGKELSMWLFSRRQSQKFDLLFHLKGRDGKKISRKLFSPERGLGRRSKDSKYFPPTRVHEMLHAAKNIRDKMCLMLMFFGGIRISELLHIFVSDVILDRRTGEARVILADPEQGAYNWSDNHGKKHRGTRAAFLKNRYGRLPRNSLGASDPYFAGWKGMLLDDSRQKSSEVQWLHESLGRAFWELYCIYMRNYRNHIGDPHPYLFISLDESSFASPLKLKNSTFAPAHSVQHIEITLTF